MEFHNILVPVIEPRAGEEAVRLVCSLVKKNKGKTKACAVYVITIKRSLPVDAELQPEIETAEEIMDHIESVAEEEGFRIETDVLQARETGPAIIDEAVERGVDLILLGITPKVRFGQYTMGDVVPYILKNAPCRVILYQHTNAGQA